MSDNTTNMTTICNFTIEGITSFDKCAIGVIAGGGALFILACIMMCIGILCCCKKASRRKPVHRTKPLITTQAASWFTSSLTGPRKQKKESSEQASTRDKAPNTDANKKLKIEEGGRGHVYQTLQLDEMDYESMYTRTVPKKQ